MCTVMAAKRVKQFNYLKYAVDVTCCPSFKLVGTLISTSYMWKATCWMNCTLRITNNPCRIPLKYKILTMHLHCKTLDSCVDSCALVLVTM